MSHGPNLTQKDISNLQDAQLNFLRRVMEVPKSTPIAELFLVFCLFSMKLKSDSLYFERIQIMSMNCVVSTIFF